jgi:iron complex transport system substrate-binding protein
MNDLNEDTKAKRIGAETREGIQESSPLRGFVPSCEKDIEELSRIVVDCGYKLHIEAGPGLLEIVYEVVLAKMLTDLGLAVKRQVPIPIRLMGLSFDEGFRADIIVEDRLLIELKSVENLAAVHSKQVITYLRLLNLPLGLLINFGAATFKEGCKRIVNGPQSFVTSCEPIPVSHERAPRKTLSNTIRAVDGIKHEQIA